jgi:hypothetical protein
MKNINKNDLGFVGILQNKTMLIIDVYRGSVVLYIDFERIFASGYCWLN